MLYYCCSASVVQLQLDSGWDPNVVDKNNHSPLDQVCIVANMDKKKLAVRSNTLDMSLKTCRFESG